MRNGHVTPVFILSLPRSGSTLLQRILSAHPDVATVAEPWILLPFFYPLEREGVYAEYSHIGTHTAIGEFIEKLPNGLSDYYRAVNRASSYLYEKAAGPQARFFIDKSPRYSLVSSHLLRAFPEAKIIFLWRNPLDMLASINKTWGKGRWFPYKYKVDLYAGFDRLLRAHGEATDRSISVKYEDLVKEPEREVRKICSYLGISFSSNLVDDISRNVLDGSMGDPTGAAKYRSVSSASLGNWHKELNTRYRRWWAKSYLEWIGEERLRAIGYEFQEMIDQLKTARPGSGFGLADLLWALYGNLVCYGEASLVKQKIRRARNWTTVYKHD